ncbi:MAG TPA: SRPBCC domain-containing protein, partial [Actinomycetota bacterium]|nr:SRPBCC domain-containing protein [Actinomycetota bacterium]
MAHRFEIDKTIEVGATPEQVWQAITTGPGLDSWFMGRNEV